MTIDFENKFRFRPIEPIDETALDAAEFRLNENLKAIPHVDEGARKTRVKLIFDDMLTFDRMGVAHSPEAISKWRQVRRELKTTPILDEELGAANRANNHERALELIRLGLLFGDALEQPRGAARFFSFLYEPTNIDHEAELTFEYHRNEWQREQAEAARRAEEARAAEEREQAERTRAEAEARAEQTRKAEEERRKQEEERAQNEAGEKARAGQEAGARRENEEGRAGQSGARQQESQSRRRNTGSRGGQARSGPESRRTSGRTTGDSEKKESPDSKIIWDQTQRHFREEWNRIPSSRKSDSVSRFREAMEIFRPFIMSHNNEDLIANRAALEAIMPLIWGNLSVGNLREFFNTNLENIANRNEIVTSLFVPKEFRSSFSLTQEQIKIIRDIYKKIASITHPDRTNPKAQSGESAELIHLTNPILRPAVEEFFKQLGNCFDKTKSRYGFK